jgi:hypothetical protein
VWRYFDATTGEFLRVEAECVGARLPGQPAAAAALPPPPSPQRVLDAAPLPAPAVNLSPPGRAPVGFEVWLWWGADPSVGPLTVAIDGWSATIDVHLVEVTFDPGDGSGPRSGAEATYVYQWSGSYTVTAAVTWAGTITLTHPSAPGTVVTQPVSAATFTASEPMDVYEVEAIIVG